jgi:hypothetical protein
LLEDVPEELKTPELCLAAVKNNGIAFEYVPDTIFRFVLPYSKQKNRQN